MSVPIKSPEQAARVTRVGEAFQEFCNSADALEDGDVPPEAMYEFGQAVAQAAYSMVAQALATGYEPPEDDEDLIELEEDEGDDDDE